MNRLGFLKKSAAVSVVPAALGVAAVAERLGGIDEPEGYAMVSNCEIHGPVSITSKGVVVTGTTFHSHGEGAAIRVTSPPQPWGPA